MPRLLSASEFLFEVFYDSRLRGRILGELTASVVHTRSRAMGSSEVMFSWDLQCLWALLSWVCRYLSLL